MVHCSLCLCRPSSSIKDAESVVVLMRIRYASYFLSDYTYKLDKSSQSCFIFRKMLSEIYEIFFRSGIQLSFLKPIKPLRRLLLRKSGPLTLFFVATQNVTLTHIINVEEIKPDMHAPFIKRTQQRAASKQCLHQGKTFF